MRLIDADELMLRYSNSEDVPITTPEEQNVYVAAVNDFYDHIGASPTIEAEPVIHGRWIIEPGIGQKCSNCDFDIGNDLEIEYANYCPHCGAKMDKE